jgi:hypothetical protein
MPYAESVRRPSTLPTVTELYLAGADGSAWYAEARESIRRYADMHGLSVGIVADVVGLTSPRQTVKRNTQLADLYLQTGGTGGVLPAVRSGLAHWAASIESGEIDARHMANVGPIRGDKTRNFARCLAGDDSAIVIDVWMFRALGLDFPTMTAKRYRQACETVRGYAKSFGDTPANTQARIWCGIRRAYGYTTDAPLIMPGVE